MKWFDRWLSKKMQQAWNTSQEKDYHPKVNSISTLLGSSHSTKSGLDRDATMQFRIHKAENGWIIELTGVDRKTERHYSKLHIIGEEEDFDQSLCHIITVESLRS